jgi:hypothetical protein
MSLTTLKDDLLREFREERIMINEQIEILDPLATSLRKPEAQRLLSSSTLILTEFICYVVSLGGMAFIALMHKIYPFSLLSDVFYNSEMRNKIGAPNLFYLILGIYGIAIVVVILVFIVGRTAREIRMKNDILNVAGKDIKTIVGQHLERKAALETIEQRHMLGLSEVGQPEKNNTVAIPSTPFRATGVNGPINEIRNPGFG